MIQEVEPKYKNFKKEIKNKINEEASNTSSIRNRGKGVKEVIKK